MIYKGVDIPQEFFYYSYPVELNIADLWIYSMIATSADWEFNTFIPATRKELAILANVTERSVYNIVDRLIASGLIETNGSSFSVNDFTTVGELNVNGGAE